MNIAARTGMAVPIPCPANFWPRFDRQRQDIGLAQAVEYTYNPANPAPMDDEVEVFLVYYSAMFIHTVLFSRYSSRCHGPPFTPYPLCFAPPIVTVGSVTA